MGSKYKIVLFKDGKKYKVFSSTNIKRNAFSKYKKLLKQKKPLFTTEFMSRKKCVFEVAVIGPSTTHKTFKKDELGRNLTISLDSSEYEILDLSPYWKEELVYDHQLKNRVFINDILEKYLHTKEFKQVFTLNNKLVIQKDEDFSIFSLKNIDDSVRLLSVLQLEFQNVGRYDCLFVPDTSTAQRKLLYDLLEKAGYCRKFLSKHYTY